MPAAFPGAYGWGAGATGGRGGSVIHVTNLNDAQDPVPAGSLRAALNTSGARIIVFDVAGVIETDGSLFIINPYVTIAGQTAPGSGITIEGAGLNIQTHNIIVRYLRFRGDGISEEAWTALRPSYSCHDVIIDHCSYSWVHNDALDGFYGDQDSFDDMENITIQNCLYRGY